MAPAETLAKNTFLPGLAVQGRASYQTNASLCSREFSGPGVPLALEQPQEWPGWGWPPPLIWSTCSVSATPAPGDRTTTPQVPHLPRKAHERFHDTVSRCLRGGRCWAGNKQEEAVQPCQGREEFRLIPWEATLQFDLKGQAESPGWGAGGGRAWTPGEASWQKAGGMGFPE